MATRKNKSVKKQKIYKMKGCSKKHSRCSLGVHKCSKNCNCSKRGGSDPIAPLAYPYKINGGCGSCSPIKGGSFFKTDLSPIPNPLQGQSWLPRIIGWPGVDGVDNNRNFLANNLYKADPQTMMKLNGGALRRKGKGKGKNGSRKLIGGSLIPQAFVNLGRDLAFNFKSTFNSLNGYEAPVNPKPYMDQFNKSNRM